MEQYAIKMQKKLRKGFTTGTCAAAAAQAAAKELLLGVSSTEIVVQLPGGERLTLPVVRDDAYQSFWKDSAELADAAKQAERVVSYYVVKDSGDDPDVTNESRIYTTILRMKGRVQLPQLFSSGDFPGLYLTGGYGVGTVTKPGLEQTPGFSAINRVPRKMIFEAVDTVVRLTDADSFSKENDELLILISVPEGRRLAERTFNPQLGIVGGISILGTSGIVEPMSEAALVATIEIEVRQVLKGGQTQLVFVPGNYGERYVRTELGLSTRCIQCSNYVGEAIDLAAAYGAESVLLVGNFGKLVKLAGGIMNTHSRTADCRWELIAVHAALCGAEPKVLQVVREAVTTDEMLHVLQDAEPTGQLQDAVLASLLGEIERHLKRRARDLRIGAVLYSEAYGYLGQTAEAAQLVQGLK